MPSSKALGGANAPLHPAPLRLRYWPNELSLASPGLKRFGVLTLSCLKMFFNLPLRGRSYNTNYFNYKSLIMIVGGRAQHYCCARVVQEDLLTLLLAVSI